MVSVTTPEQARVDVVKQKNAGYEALKVYDNITPEVYAVLVAMARQQRIPVVGHVPRTVGVEGVLRSRQALITKAGLRVMGALQMGMLRSQRRLLEPLTPRNREIFMKLLSQLVEANNHYSRAMLRAL